MGRTPDAYDGPRIDEAVIWEEQPSDPTEPLQSQFVQSKGLVILADGVVIPIGDGRAATWQYPVDEFDVDTPPSTPSTGYRVIVGDSPTGDFTGHEWEIAQYDGSAWVFTTPRQGTSAIVKGSNSPYYQTAASTPWSWNQTAAGGFFGAELNWAEDLTQSSTTSSSYQQKLRLTTTALPSGDYIVLWMSKIEGSLASTFVDVQIEWNDTTVLANAGIAPGPSSSLVFSGHAVLAAISGVQYFDIDWRRASGGGQAYIEDTRITLWRIA